MSKKNLAGLLAIPLVTIMLITGCTSPGPNTTEPPSPSPSISAPADPTPAPEETEPPVAVEDLDIGAPLTAEQAKELNRKVGTKRPYQQNDGSYIVIDVKQPLPETVKNEVVESISTTDSSDLSSFFRKTDEESMATGKTLIVIRYMSASDLNGNPITAWMASSAATGFPGFNGGSPEDVAAQAQAWANTTRNPAQYEVVIVQ